MINTTIPTVIPQDFSFSETNYLIYAMIEVARADGITLDEKNLIKEFSRGIIDDFQFEKLCYDKDFPQLFISTEITQDKKESILFYSILVAMVDSVISDKEKQVLISLSEKLNFTKEQLNNIIDLVCENLLSSISHLPDASSCAIIASELNKNKI